MSEEQILVTEIEVAATSYKKGTREKGGDWHKYSLKDTGDSWYETFENDVAWEGAIPWKDISKGDSLILRYVVREKNGYVNNIIQSIEDPATYDGEEEGDPFGGMQSDSPFGNSSKPVDWDLEGPAENPEKVTQPEAKKPAKPAKKAAKKPAKAAKEAPAGDQSAPPLARCMGDALDLIKALRDSLPEDAKFSADALLDATVQLAIALYQKEL
jgi:hypothetical protein